MKPRIFISAVTQEFGKTRQTIANILTRLGYEPVSQEIPGTAPGDLRQVLRQEIDGCEGLIHLAGHAYGTEPPVEDLAYGRSSYTQFEFLYAANAGKKTWLLFPGDDYTRDTPVNLLDLPPDPSHPDPNAYQAERRQLQVDHIARLKTRSGHLWHEPANLTALELAIERLNDEFAKLREREDRWRRWVKKGFSITILLLAVLGGGVHLQWRSQQARFDEIKEGQTISKARVHVRIVEAAEATRDAALAAADRLSVPAERQRARDVAEAECAVAVDRAAEFAAEFARLVGEDTASSVLQEMARILDDPTGDGGVGPALDYFESQRGGILERVRARQVSERARNRADLLTTLQAARLYSSQSRHDDARAAFREVLELEPDWSQALTDCLWFLSNRAGFEKTHGSFARAIADAEEALPLARHLHELKSLESSDQEARRAVSAFFNQIGDIQSARGNPGDAEAALEYYEEGLAIARALRTTKPTNSEAERDVSISLTRIADLLVERRHPGDAKRALGHYEECVAIARELRAAHAGSSEAQRDTALALGRVADFLVGRSQSGDANAALGYYEESLALFRGLQTANSKDYEAKRDVAIALDRMGDFLFGRRGTGDSEEAFAHYEESLDLRRELKRDHPSSAEATRDVSVSLDKLGEFLSRRGHYRDAEDALAHFTDSLAIRRDLRESNPVNSEAVRDVSLALDKLGDFYLHRTLPGDTPKAGDFYEESLALRRELLSGNPKNGTANRNLSVSLNKMGDFLLERWHSGDANLAIDYYEESLTITRELRSANPETGYAARDVLVSLVKLGDVLAKRGQTGDLESALAHLEESLALARTLQTANPETAEAARDVSVSLIKLGEILLKLGRPGAAETALSYYKESLEISRKLHEADPWGTQAARDVLVSLVALGDFLLSRNPNKHLFESLNFYVEGLEIARALHDDDPNNTEAAKDRAILLFKISTLLVATGGLKEAVPLLLERIQIIDAFSKDGRPLELPMKEALEKLRADYVPASP